MKNNTENTSLALSRTDSYLEMIKNYIEINKIDKNILTEILGVPSEIMVIRKLYSNFGYFVVNEKILRTKQSVLMRVKGNIYQSKMSKAEKIYCYTLLNIIIGDS
tara:strand:- start:455 stop:769 length:315 start_codon:yes stop_codon:yes gene_type:complete